MHVNLPPCYYCLFGLPIHSNCNIRCMHVKTQYLCLQGIGEVSIYNVIIGIICIQVNSLSNFHQHISQNGKIFTL